MNCLTHDAVNAVRLAVYGDETIAGTKQREWPEQAVIGLVRQDNVAQEWMSAPLLRASSQWVAVIEPSAVVGFAVAATSPQLPTIRNRAYTGFRHSDLHKGLRAQSASRACRPRRVRCLYTLRIGGGSR